MNKADFKTLMVEAHQIAVSHGWYERTPLDGDTQCNLCSELMEAWDEYAHNRAIDEVYITKDQAGNYKENGVPVELADFAIRVFDAMEHWEAPEDIIEQGLSMGDRLIARYVETSGGMDKILLNTLLVYLMMLVTDASDRGELATFVTAGVQTLECWCNEHEIDLLAQVRRKMEYNKTRSYRHGGKRV
ncbi:MAG: hypothetical protein PHI98_01255 [Eubacteriales bacterium]|nr:hypothetical protein [Eubacteriales bacterium]